MTQQAERREHYGGRGPFNLPYSRVVRAGDFVFVSGQVGVDAQGQVVPGGIEAETRRILERVAEALALAGCTLADLVKVTVYLADRNDFARFNEAYAAFFPKDPPARTTVVTDLLIDVKVELDVVAYKPAS